MDKVNNEEFKLKYSAPTDKERKEIESIRREYAEKTESENKLFQLRKLDKKVRSVPKYIAITMGILGLMIFGFGMSMVLEWGLLIGGIVASAIGAVIMVANYFVYKFLLNHAKRKYSIQIIALSEDLLNNDDKIIKL